MSYIFFNLIHTKQQVKVTVSHLTEDHILDFLRKEMPGKMKPEYDYFQATNNK